MIVFSNILKNKFEVVQYTSNCPSFFQMANSEFSGAKLKSLMPNIIAQQHDNYLTDYVNQTNSEISETGAMLSFAVTKYNNLRLVNVIVKVEYYMTDDIYLCAILVPHKSNKHPMMLVDDNGLFICQNEKSETILGTSVNQFPYSLYCMMPGLFRLMWTRMGNNYRSFTQNVGARRNIVLDSQNTDVFFYGNMKNRQVLNHPDFKHSAENDWKLTSKNTQIMKKNLDIIKNRINANKTLFVNKIGNIKRMAVSMEKFVYKKGVTCKLLYFKTIKNIKDHHRDYLEIFVKTTLSNKNPRLFMINPYDLSLIRKPSFKNMFF